MSEISNFRASIKDFNSIMNKIIMLDDTKKFSKEKYGKVDILLNCAGSSKDKGVLDMTDEEWDFTIATDETSVFKMTRAFAKIMQNKW